jgi:hypothetical protein
VARTVSTGAATQITDIQRTDSFGPGLLRIGRDLRLTVSVRTPAVQREPVDLALSLVHLVMDDRPRPSTGAVAEAAPAATPAAPAAIPAAAPAVGRVLFTEGVRADLTGTLADLLARNRWPVRIGDLAGSPLSPRALAPALPSAMEPEGAEIARVRVPGRPGEWLVVRLHAQLGRLLEPVVERNRVGIGSIVRNQRTITGSASITTTLAAGMAAVWQALNGSTSPGTTSGIATALGKRMERSWYRRIPGYTGRYEVRFGFDVFVERDLIGQGGTAVGRRASYPNAATGDAVLTVHGSPETGRPDAGTRPWRSFTRPDRTWDWTQLVRPWWR